MTCTFFGHRTVTKGIEPTLRSTLTDLIENHNVTLFYVGNQGEFDAIVLRVLTDLARQYPIRYFVVLAYLPEKTAAGPDTAHTLLPSGIESVPKRFAISYRNRWMTEQADYVVTYVTNTVASGAAQFKKSAIKKGKTVLELAGQADYSAP